jgi:hypothetical protein
VADARAAGWEKISSEKRYNMKSIPGIIKKYWWGIFLTLLGAYMVVSTILGVIDLISGDISMHGPELSRIITNWVGLAVSWFVWLIGGMFVLEAGISRTRKNLKAAREQRGRF